MRIFGGRFRSTVSAPNQPDTVTTEDWRSLQLDIKVRFPSFSHIAYAYSLMIDIETQTARFRTRALARIPHPQLVHYKSGINEASRQTLIEVFHLYSSSISSASYTTPPVVWSKLESLSSSLRSFKSIWYNFHPSLFFSPPRQPMLRTLGGLVGPDIMTPTARQPKQLPHYSLYGVLYHHGVSASEGHCMIHVLHQNDSREAWLHVNDESVNAGQHEDIFRT